MIYALDGKAYDDHGPFGLLTAQITDAAGVPLRNTDYPKKETEVRRGLDVRDAPTAYLRVGPRRVADLLTYDLPRPSPRCA